MRWALLTLVAVLGLSGATAGATTISDPAGRGGIQPWQSWADRSLIPLPPTDYVVHFDACTRLAVDGFACAYVDNLRDIFISPDSPPSERRRLLLHEIGHMVDARYMDDNARSAFRRIAWARGGPWLSNSSAEPSAGEQFAEAFSLCAIHRRFDPYKTRGWWSAGWRPGPRRHLRVCAWFKVLAARWTTA